MRRAGFGWVLVLAACGGGAQATRTETAETAQGADREASQAAESEPAAEAAATEGAEPAPDARVVPAHGPLIEDDLHRGVLARLRDPRFPSCTVSALPPALRRRTTPTGNDDLARAVSFTLPDDTVSAGRAGDRELAIYLSAALDPRSEVGDLGYRVRVHTGGAERDLSMGITAQRPLVLVHNPMLPLVEDGILQLEAQLRAIDDASIDFVPAEGLTTIRSERELLVRCALDDLERDQDRDGLTDLEEERLVTDIWDPDTDGDGRRDGEDRSPLGAAPAGTPADEVWLAAYRQVVRPEAASGLLLVARSGARLDAGDEGEGRVLMLREDELGAYQRRFGLRAPLVIAVTMRGDDRARVEVDDAWHEAAYDATRANGAWTLARRGGRR